MHSLLLSFHGQALLIKVIGGGGGERNKKEIFGAM